MSWGQRREQAVSQRPTGPNSYPDDPWLTAALQELRRLQEEFRLLQNQSHAIVGASSGVIGVAVLAGGSSVADLVLIVSTIVLGTGLTWYLNINAEADVVGMARDELATSVNQRVANAVDGIAIYSGVVQKAGKGALSTVLLLTRIGLASLAIVGVGLWVAFNNPQGTSFLSSPWREIAQGAATGWALVSVLTALRSTNGGYRDRFSTALVEARDRIAAQ